MSVTNPIEQSIAKIVHSAIFFEEFTFSKNKFCPPGQSEVELADAVVLLGDALLVYQIKERIVEFESTPDTERNWFKAKVLKKATKQIRDTLQYIKSCGSIWLDNERGRQFQISADEVKEIIKIVVFKGNENLPQTCSNQKSHQSKTAGFIHIFETENYLQMIRLLRVPEDVIRYLRYRENMLQRFGAACSKLPEASMVGGFIGEGDDVPPSLASYENLHRMVPDEDNWDISSYLRSLRDNTNDPSFGDDYYAILDEFVRLPRSM
jgi:hypothetical protein